MVYFCPTWMAPPAVPGVLLDPAGSQGGPIQVVHSPNAKFIRHFLVYCCPTWMAPSLPSTAVYSGHRSLPAMMAPVAPCHQLQAKGIFGTSFSEICQQLMAG